MHFCEQVDEKRKMAGESSLRLALIYEFLSNTGDDCGQLPEEIRESFNKVVSRGAYIPVIARPCILGFSSPSLRGAAEEMKRGATKQSPCIISNIIFAKIASGDCFVAQRTRCLTAPRNDGMGDPCLVKMLSASN